ncbi:Hypothetical_protein [Hexamita inflata]|uniref:Hypothetical_protein n=1 Tax=Hexamita inflata TaxID=28002 RepID=A0AA86P0Q8_9EUKA|nr:Hypothetical protein HINF_LOCUS16505 [Hexamita inflata]
MQEFGTSKTNEYQLYMCKQSNQINDLLQKQQYILDKSKQDEQNANTNSELISYYKTQINKPKPSTVQPEQQIQDPVQALMSRRAQNLLDFPLSSLTISQPVNQPTQQPLLQVPVQSNQFVQKSELDELRSQIANQNAIIQQLQFNQSSVFLHFNEQLSNLNKKFELLQSQITTNHSKQQNELKQTQNQISDLKNALNEAFTQLRRIKINSKDVFETKIDQEAKKAVRILSNSYGLGLSRMDEELEDIIKQAEKFK